MPIQALHNTSVVEETIGMIREKGLMPKTNKNTRPYSVGINIIVGDIIMPAKITLQSVLAINEEIMMLQEIFRTIIVIKRFL